MLAYHDLRERRRTARAAVAGPSATPAGTTSPSAGTILSPGATPTQPPATAVPVAAPLALPRRALALTLDAYSGVLLAALPMSVAYGSEQAPESVTLAYVTVSYVLLLIVNVTWTARAGRTLGKRLLGGCVVDRTTGTPGMAWPRALGRQVTVYAFALTGLILVSWLTALLDDRRLAWHDRIYNTAVVRSW